ncbi:response regulator [Nocardioides litoris]|uniref:response regulator n=1 Tax=Nocardioides litoris TaxID=1926648 RepID=UPI001121143F|nr:response regulator [Nocardioides litoris]
MATVLVADDDTDIAQLVRRVLTSAGHDVLVAPDGVRALVHVAAVDLVVLDVSMPTLDGHEVTALLRETHHTHDVPVLVISSDTTPAAIEAALDAGADGYLPKPIVPTELVRRVDHLLATTAGSRRAARRVGALRRRRQDFIATPSLQ